MPIRKPSNKMVYFKSAALVVALLAVYIFNAKTEGGFCGGGPGGRVPGGRQGDRHDGAKDFAYIAWESEIDFSRHRLLRSMRSMRMARKKTRSY
jgi:hypothetical protein